MKTYGTVSSLELVNLLFCRGEHLRGNYRLQHLLNQLPELVVVGFQQDDEAGGLRVEGRGHVQDGVSDKLDDTVVGGRGFLVQSVVGATFLDDVPEGVRSGHCGG